MGNLFAKSPSTKCQNEFQPSVKSCRDGIASDVRDDLALGVCLANLGVLGCGDASRAGSCVVADERCSGLSGSASVCSSSGVND